MDDNKEEPSEIKTHKEIQALFDDLQTLEEQIKNPEPRLESAIQSNVILQEAKQQIKSPTLPKQQVLEPAGEIHYHKSTRQKQLLFRTQVSEEEPGHRVISRSSLSKQKKILDIQPEVTDHEDQQPLEVKPFRSTFVLDIDSNGNLVGFPVKKQKPGKEPGGETGEHPETEPATGIKGKLMQIGSRLRRKSSSEGEAEGILEKIKGIFRRKS